MFTPSSYNHLSNLWQSHHQYFLKKAVLMFRELSQKKSVHFRRGACVGAREITTIYVCVCVGARETSRIENNKKVIVPACHLWGRKKGIVLNEGNIA